MSRKIPGGHRHDMSSARAPDFAVTKAASSSDAGSAACDVKLAPPGRGRPRAAGADVGRLLRGAYRQTVEEAIPDDLLDLLNRLE